MTEEVKQLSPVEQRAIEQGWRPKEEFEGDESEFIDAPEFVRRGELFSKIEHQNKELKATRQALETFKQHYSRVKEVEYERALKSLQQVRKQAMVDGETERALDLEEKIDALKEEKEVFTRQAQAPAVQQVEGEAEFTAWVSKNGWYEKDPIMKGAADAIGLEYAKKGWTPDQVLAKVSQDIRKEFPHKFASPAQARPAAVEGSSRTGATKTATVRLSDEQERVAAKLIKIGAMTREEYIADLKKMGELNG